MENTLENKTKFFAQYWGQQVLSWSGDTSSHRFNIIGKSNLPIRKGDYLELKPLSAISDEECLQISKWLENNESGFDARPCNIKTYARVYARKCYYVSDYLRSKGYAIPFMGISVEQLIEYGFVKLKQY